MSKFLVPLSLSDFLESPGNVFAQGFVGVYMLNSQMKLMREGVESDLVLDRMLDGFDQVVPVAPVFAQDTVLTALIKLQGSLNSLTLEGDVAGTAEYKEGKLVIATSIQGSFVDANWVFVQNTPSLVWSISHPLGKRPSVTCLDTADGKISGEEEYPNDTLVIITYTTPVAGKAILN